jgi:hypothetical protein
MTCPGVENSTRCRGTGPFVPTASGSRDGSTSALPRDRIRIRTSPGPQHCRATASPGSRCDPRSPRRSELPSYPSAPPSLPCRDALAVVAVFDHSEEPSMGECGSHVHREGDDRCIAVDPQEKVTGRKQLVDECDLGPLLVVPLRRRISIWDVQLVPMKSRVAFGRREGDGQQAPRTRPVPWSPGSSMDSQLGAF